MPSRKISYLVLFSCIGWSLLLLLLVYKFSRHIPVTSTVLRKHIVNTAPTSVPTRKPTPTPVTITDQVDWLDKPEKVSSNGFFRDMDKKYPYELEYEAARGTKILRTSYESKATYYLVGTMKYKYAGSPVYMGTLRKLPSFGGNKGARFYDEIVYGDDLAIIFIKTQEGKFIITKDYYSSQILCHSAGDCVPDVSRSSNEDITYDNELTLDPVGSNSSQYIDEVLGTARHGYVSIVTTLLDDTGYNLIKKLDHGYTIYAKQNLGINNLTIDSIITPDIIIRLPTGLYYRLSDEEMNNYLFPDDDGKFLWSDPEFNDTDFAHDTYSTNFYKTYSTNLENNQPLINALAKIDKIDVNSLKKVAKIDRNDGVIYDLPDNDLLFKPLYEGYVANNPHSQDTQLDYQAYKSAKPIFVWKMPIGIYRAVFNEKLASVWFGEPLIYLYPQKDTVVSIKLSSKIILGKTIPEYSNSWEVITHRDGSIYDQKTGKRYSSLYWEGGAGFDEKPVLLSTISQKDVPLYIDRSLENLGLNNIEREGFVNYWKTRLNKYPYYSLSFYGNEALDRSLPLIVSPSPDTLIRVVMKYKGVQNLSGAYDMLELYSQSVPIRRGFTLVELGVIGE